MALVKLLVSRNFSPKKCEREFPKFPTENISSKHLFSNFFIKTVTFTKFLPKMRESVLRKFTLTENISSKHLFSNFLSKNVTFTKICQKCARVNSRNFHTVYYYLDYAANCFT